MTERLGFFECVVLSSSRGSPFYVSRGKIMPDPVEKLNTGGATNRGLVIQGVVGQAADLQQWQQTTDGMNYTVAASIDPSGNLTAPLLNASTGTSVVTRRLLMKAARYNLVGSTNDPSILQDVVAMAPNSDPTVLAFTVARPVMWQFHATDIQNANDTILLNVNSVQRFNIIDHFDFDPATQGGSGYTSVPSVNILNDGATPPTATATLSVASVTVTNGGSSYTSAPNVVFTSTSGSGAAATAILTGNQVTGVAVTNSGSGYTSPPTVGFTGGGGSGAQATAIMQVAAVTITSTGAGRYVSPLISFAGGGGTGAAAAATLSVASVSIPAGGGGSGYTSAPTVTFSAPPQGITASGTANISGGGVTGINLLNAGSGYASPPVVAFSGGGGTGAAGTAYISGGAVTSVAITNPGAGYTSAPTVTFAPAPSGITATGTVSVSGGAVNGVTVLTPGSGYTSAPTISFSGGGGTGATAIPVMQLASVTVYPGGLGYTSPPTLTITGNGVLSLASASCTIDGSGHVATVTINNKGTNYFTPPPIRFSGGGGSGAQATAVLAQIGRTGIESCHYTMPNNGGEVSALVAVQTGGGNAITCYKMSETGRTSGLDNYANSGGYAIECGTADQWYAVGCFVGGFNAANTSGGFLVILGCPTSKGILITPGEGTQFDGRVAYAIGGVQMNQPDSNLTFWVQMNGNISTLGVLAVGGPAGLVSQSVMATIISTSDSFKGLVVRAHSASQSANLQEWQDSSGNVLGSIGPKGAFTGSMDTVTPAATITLDVAKGTLHKATATSGTAATVKANGPGNAGGEMTVLVINNATATFAVTFSSSDYFETAGPVNFAATNSVALLRFVSDGGKWYEVARSIYPLT
jgi:hypothetical protein